MKIKTLALMGVSCALYLSPSAFAETKWAPPAEIASKVKEEAAAAAPAAPATKVDADKACAAEADGKGLKGRARKHYVQDCKKH